MARAGGVDGMTLNIQGVVLSRPSASGIGLALLTAETADELAQTASQLASTESMSITVTGLMPLIKEGGSIMGAALRLLSPVRINVTPGNGPLLETYALDGVGNPLTKVDLPEVVLAGQGFAMEASVDAWLGGLATGVLLDLRAVADIDGHGVVTIQLGAKLRVPWLKDSVELAATELSKLVARIQSGHFELDHPIDGLAALLPIGATFAGDLILTVDWAGNALTDIAIKAEAIGLDVPMGSPAAVLSLRPPEGEAAAIAVILDLGSGSMQVVGSSALEIVVDLHWVMANTLGNGQIAGTGRLVPLVATPQAIASQEAGVQSARSPFAMKFGQWPKPAQAQPLIKLDQKGLSVSTTLLKDNLPEWLNVDAAFDFAEAAGDFIGGHLAALSCKVDSARPVLAITQTELSLAFHVSLSCHQNGKTLLEATGGVGLTSTCALDGGWLVLGESSFVTRAALDNITLTRTVGGGNNIDIGTAASLSLPENLQAKLDLSGQGDMLTFMNLEANPIGLKIPKDGGFNFDVNALSFGRGGVSLAAKVRAGAAEIPGLTGLDTHVRVREARSGAAGELRVVHGRLTEASLEAESSIPFFDDATGVMHLKMFQAADSGLSATASFDIGVGRNFNIRGLCMIVDVDSIHLSLSYSSVGNTWSADGGITGSLAFDSSALEGKLAEYSELFDGKRMHFENLDISRLGQIDLSIELTPRTLNIGDLFVVKLHGIKFGKLGEPQAWKRIGLLGDIDFKTKLPSLEFGLTLGEISLAQINPGDLLPKIGINRLGMSGGLPGGVELKAMLQEIDSDEEYGFGGEVHVKAKSLPGMDGALKLTRLRPRQNQPGDRTIPAIMVYVDVEREDHLAYGFFLRLVGLGVGINQGLRNFSDEAAREQPIAQRVNQALASGIYDPARIEYWRPVRKDPSGTAVSIVAAAQVSFGLLARDVEHLLMTSMVLSVDDNLDIIAGINGWFFTSPDQARQADFLARPAMRGAIGLSPREQVFYGRFITMQGSKTGGDGAAGMVARMLADCLVAGRLPVSFYADPRGALIELAYPRQGRFTLDLGIVRGAAEAGFRFGYYRETLVIGANLAAQAELHADFSADLGFANVELSARADFALQASFAGAFTTQGRAYLLADVVITAALEISAHVYKRIRVHACFCSFTVTLFDVSASVGLSVTAALTSALTPDGIGFAGAVDVHINVAGFGLGARLRLAANEGRIGEARNTIDRLVPPIDQLIGPSPAPPVITAQPEVVQSVANLKEEPKAVIANIADKPPTWKLHLRDVQIPGGKHVIRIVLFPVGPQGSYQEWPAGQSYATQRKHTLKFTDDLQCLEEMKVVRSQGSSIDLTNRTASLVEDAQKQLVSLEEMRKQIPSADQPLRVGDLLLRPAVNAPASIVDGEEIVDIRTRHPAPGDFDDEAVSADPRRRSTRFRIRRAADGAYGSLTYDDHLAKAQLAHDAKDNFDADDGQWNAEILSYLLRLAEMPNPDEKTAGPNELDPMDFAGALGLVLEVPHSKDLFEKLSHGGLGALVESATMFGTAVEVDTGKKAKYRFDEDWCQWFQGRGEIGLAWQLSQQGEGGAWISKGPRNHADVRIFRVRRIGVLSGDASGGVADAVFEVIPHWASYITPETSVRTFIRPRFGFLDDSLPPDRAVLLTYIVEAFGGTDGQQLLATQQFENLYYDPARSPVQLRHAQVVLRRLDDKAAIEIAVMFEAKGEVVPQDIAKRLRLWRRKVAPGVIGRYGAADETDVSLNWTADIEKCSLRLPTPSASRGSDADLLRDAEELEVQDWHWTAWEIDAGTEEAKKESDERKKQGYTSWVLTTKLELVSGQEEDFWNKLKLVISNQNSDEAEAAEIFVGVAPTSDLLHPQAGTPPMRCRSALANSKSVLPPEAGAAAISAEALFSEGRQVASIECMRLTSRAAEWLPASSVVAVPEVVLVADDGSDGVQHAQSVEARLSVSWPHWPLKQDDVGVPVEYRVWWWDEIDDQKIFASRLVAVQPERFFRTQPEAVFPSVRPNGQGATPVLDWVRPNFKKPLAVKKPQDVGGSSADTAVPIEQNSMSESFVHVLTASGREAVVTKALAKLLEVEGLKGSHGRLEIAEPLLPPAAGPDAKDRIPELLERCVPATDQLGWKLLEALGASATVWFESDDDRVNAEEVLKRIDDVACICFERLPEGLQARDGRSMLYGLRVFDLGMLSELWWLAENKGKEGYSDRLNVLTKYPSGEDDNVANNEVVARPLQHALAWLAPTPLRRESCIELLERLAGLLIWGDYVSTATENNPLNNCTQFVRIDLGPLPPPDVPVISSTAPVTPLKPESRARTSATEGPIVLPAVDGWVRLVVPLGSGYAQRLHVGIEVSRRHETGFRDPKEAIRELASHSTDVIDVPRTLQLLPDIAAISINGEAATIEAHVTVHPAQRLVSTRQSLRQRVGHVEQRVTLQRKADPSFIRHAVAIHSVIEDLDEDAYRKSWATVAGPVPSVEQWRALPARRVSLPRGVETFSFPLLPAGYLWSVEVETSADVRSSVEAVVGHPDIPAVLPLYAEHKVDTQDERLVLAYEDQEFTRRIESGRVIIELPLPRAIDALPSQFRAWWTGPDLTWVTGSGLAVPILCLPDPRARYVFTVRSSAGSRVDLLLLEIGDPAPVTKWLWPQARRADKPDAWVNVLPSWVQLNSQPKASDWTGRLGLRVELPLATEPSLAWLWKELGGSTPTWTLEVSIERDGVRYPCKEIS